MASGDLISRIYSNFRGVDFRGEEINLVRSPDSLNIWRNYKKTEGIETRPGMIEWLLDGNFLVALKNYLGEKYYEKAEYEYDTTVYGIFFYNDVMIVHCGTFLYKSIPGELTVLYEGINAVRSDAFIFNNLWYFKDGKHYLQYDGKEIRNVCDFAYIPTTTIGRRAGSMGGGTIHEDVNLLTPFRTNTFIGDNTNTVFCVDVELPNAWKTEDGYTWFDAPIDLEDVTFSVNGVEYSGIYSESNPYQLMLQSNDEIGCYFTIEPAPPEPSTTGQDNVSITFPICRKEKYNALTKIPNCTLLQVFDNRVFFSGNPDYPNMMWHCSLNDPTYCSDLDYYNEGLDFAKVKGMVAGNNALWVFKEPSQANTSVFYHTPTIDAEYGKIYPNTHSNISTGCVGKAINFNDDIVFFSERGMEGISGDITSEQVISHRSSLVDSKLTAEPEYKDMLLEEWEGYLLVFIGNKVYLADSRAMFTNENHGEYEWFYWELDKRVTCAIVSKGTLYLGANDGVYTLTGNELPVKSYWVTPKDKFKHPQYLKTTNKRGCVVEATTLREDATITVYAKTEKDDDFEAIGTYANVEDYFVCRIKRKKWKDIQLKFSSDIRFSLETATLESFVGGYTKR